MSRRWSGYAAAGPIAWVGAVLVVGGCGETPPPMIPPPPCVPATQMALGGVHLGDTREQVLARFGRPESSRSLPVNSQGRTAEVLSYAGHAAVLVVGVVDSLYSESEDVGTPGGLRPGVVLQDAERGLGIPLSMPAVPGNPITIYQCVEADSTVRRGLSIALGAASIVRSVALWNRSP